MLRIGVERKERKKKKEVRTVEAALHWHDLLCTKAKGKCTGRKVLEKKLKTEKDKLK